MKESDSAAKCASSRSWPARHRKTRLALQAAEGAASAFPNGVYFVDLSPVTDPDWVPATIARAVRLQEAGGQTDAGAIDPRTYLRGKSLLLVLDNFEQVMPRCKS